MPKKDIHAQSETRLSLMLWALLLAMITGPVFSLSPSIHIVLNLLLSFIFISGIYAVTNRRIIAIFACLTAIPMLIFLWEDYLPSGPDMHIIGPVSTIIFTCLVIESIYLQINQTTRISSHSIKGALVIYLLLGFGWAMIHLLLYTYNPAGYTGINPDIDPNLSNVFFYFSFVTLTTLGYGDISPVLDIHRSFTMLEAIIGQIYLVVVVAWLVGMKVAQDLEEKIKQK